MKTIKYEHIMFLSGLELPVLNVLPSRIRCTSISELLGFGGLEVRRDLGEEGVGSWLEWKPSWGDRVSPGLRLYCFTWLEA